MQNPVKIEVAVVVAIGTWAIVLNCAAPMKPFTMASGNRYGLGRPSSDAALGSSTFPSANGIDESRGTARPIEYDIMGSTVNAVPNLVSVTSDHGVVAVHAVAADGSAGDEINREHPLPAVTAPLSTVPVDPALPTLWKHSGYAKPVKFITDTTDTSVTLKTGDGHRIWRLRVPPAQFVLSIEANRKTVLEDAHGQILWTGQASLSPNGIFWTSAGDTARLNYNGVGFMFGKNGSIALTATLGSETRAAMPSSTAGPLWRGFFKGSTHILSLQQPGSRQVMVMSPTAKGFDNIVYWQTGLHVETEIDIERGQVTVTDKRGKSYGTKPVDIASLSTRSNGQQYVDPNTLVEPIAPDYSDGSILRATYSSASGMSICTENIAYQKLNTNGQLTAQVTRTLFRHTIQQKGDSTKLPDTWSNAFTYNSTTMPASKVWNW